jgi:hypothetical protein
MGCTAVGCLTSARHGGQTFTYAVTLVDNSVAGETADPSRLGALNTLLGCVNRET